MRRLPSDPKSETLIALSGLAAKSEKTDVISVQYEPIKNGGNLYAFFIALGIVKSKTVAFFIVCVLNIV